MKISIPPLLKRLESPNLLSELDAERISKISRRCLEDLETDEQSRQEWLEKNKECLDLAMQVSEAKNDPWEGCANIKYPLLTVAALQFHARAYPAVIQGNQVVKGQVTGEDPQGMKSEKAVRIGKHMSYQLLEEMPEWEEETDRLLMILPIIGCVFRKSYFSKQDGHNCSRMVMPQNLVVNYKAKSILTVARITELFPLYPQEIIERQMQGLYDDSVEIKFGADKDTEEPQEMIEQHCLIDLDEDGYKEPYVVTIHKESEKVLRLVADFDRDTIFVKQGDTIISLAEIEENAEAKHREQISIAQAAAQLAQQKGVELAPPQIPPPTINYDSYELAKLEPVRWYTKYSFIPSPDGGIYDIGFGWLLYHIVETINTTVNQLLDAGTASNMLAGFMAKGLLTDKKGDTRFKIGEFKQVDNLTGGPIKDAIVQLTFQPPSQVLFSLLNLMIEAASDITSVKDIMMGESERNETATTTHSKVEQGMMVFSAIYKRVFRSLKSEFKKLKRLNKHFLPVESYYRVMTSGAIEKIGLTDYQGNDTDVQPIADPSVVSKSLRVAKAAALKQASHQNPLYDPYEVEKRFLEALEVENIDRLLVKKQAPPNPKTLELMAKVEEIGEKVKKMQAETVKIHTSAVKDMAESQAIMAGTDLDMLQAQIGRLEAGMKVLEALNAGQGGSAGVEAKPNDGQGNGPSQGSAAA